MKINEWYVENILVPNEGLKYFPKEYKLTILDINRETNYRSVKIEFDGMTIFYEVPPSQIIYEEGEEGNDKENKI